MFIRPRWRTPFETTKRVVGVTLLLLGATLVAPIPFSNIIPAIAIALVAFCVSGRRRPVAAACLGDVPRFAVDYRRGGLGRGAGNRLAHEPMTRTPPAVRTERAIALGREPRACY